MNKCKYIILTIILIIFLINIDLVISSTKDACILFFNKIFISIVPFIILCDVLIHYDYHLFINKIIGSIISKLFNIDENTSMIFILSMLTSHPANCIYIKDMLDSKIIDVDSANKIICFSYFPSISFVIGTIGINIYNDSKIGLLLWLFILLNNIFIGIYLRKYKNISYTNNSLIIKDSLINTIKKSILKSINTSFIILGNLIIFTIINKILFNYLDNSILLSIISGLLELTSGIINVSSLNVSYSLKLSITLFILCFSGISILFQGISILSEYKINIKRILTIKLVFSIFTSLIFYFIILLHFA